MLQCTTVRCIVVHATGAVDKVLRQCLRNVPQLLRCAEPRCFGQQECGRSLQQRLLAQVQLVLVQQTQLEVHEHQPLA